MAESFLFKVDNVDDAELLKEIGLAGWVVYKVANKQFQEDPDIGQMTINYESASQVNAGLHKKLNAIRRIVARGNPETEEEQDE